VPAYEEVDVIDRITHEVARPKEDAKRVFSIEFPSRWSRRLCDFVVNPLRIRGARNAGAKLTINVVDLRSHKGQLIFGVFDQPEGFPTDSTKSKNWQIKKINTDTVTFECELPPGVHGASVLHDENANGQMDTNAVGIPLEGYGVSNNPKPGSAPPRSRNRRLRCRREGRR